MPSRPFAIARSATPASKLSSLVRPNLCAG